MEQAVKQRLVGAAVLTALAVITLPMVFDTRRPESVKVSETIPAQPTLAPVEVQEPKPVPLLDGGADGKAPVAVADMYHLDADKPAEVDPAVETEQPVIADKPVDVSQQPSVVSKTAPATPKTPIPDLKPLPPVPPAPGGKLNAANMPEAWVVQVGAVNDKKKAEAMIAELKLNGHPAFSTVSHGDKGDTIRVFVGPKLDKAKANQLRQRIDQDLGVKSMVVSFTPK